MKEGMRRRVQWSAFGIAMLAPAVCAELYGAFPFGGGVYVGCLAAGLPIFAMLPAYAAIGIAIKPTLARMIEIAVSALAGSLAMIPVFKKKRFLFPLFALSELGRLYEIIAGENPWRALPAAALGAVALAAVLGTLSTKPDLKTAGFGVLTAVASVGLHAVPVAGAAVFGMVGCLAVRYGKPFPTAIAYALGGLLAAGDASMPLLYVLSAGAGMVADRNRWTAGAAMLSAGALYAVLFSPDPVACAAAGGGILLALALPVRRKTTSSIGETEMLPVLRSMTVAKEALKNARIVLDEAPPDEKMLAVKLGTRLCEGCASGAVCAVSGECMEEAVRRALNRGRAGLALLPDEIVERCCRAAQVPVMLGELLRGVEQENELSQMRTAAARMAADELQAFAALIERWVAQAKLPVTAEPEWQREIAAGLHARGGRLLAMARTGRGVQIVAEAEAEDVLRAVNETRRGAYSVDCETRLDGKSEFFLLPRPALGVVYGAAQTAKQGECGDVYFVKKINAVTVLAVLCDGMGSGRSAHDLSRRTVELIESCFAAGFDTAHVLNFVNALLSLAGERFSCVDLCLIDLERREASFVKAGGVESFVLRGEHRVQIEGGSLPLGADGTVASAATTVDLEPGDLVVMVTDGITDSAEPDPAVRNNPQAAADEILSAAIQADQGRPHDDMTALVLRAVS